MTLQGIALQQAGRVGVARGPGHALAALMAARGGLGQLVAAPTNPFQMASIPGFGAAPATAMPGAGYGFPWVSWYFLEFFPIRIRCTGEYRGLRTFPQVWCVAVTTPYFLF